MGQVTGGAIAGIVSALRPYGVDGSALALQAGVPSDVLADPSKRLESAIVDRFVLLAAEASGDPVFGLVVARHHALIGRDIHYAMVASDSLACAWRRMEKYGRYVGDHLKLQTTEADDFQITFSVPEPARGTWLPCDVMAGSLVLGARGMSRDRTLSPADVALRRPEPSDAEHFHRFFGTQVRFGAESNILRYALSVASKPLPLANERIAGHVDSFLGAYLSSLDESSLRDRVCGMLAAALPDGLPKRSEIARRLGTSDRALGRKLADEGTSFRQLLDEVRVDLACGYLEKNTASITEIAFLLGFSETSAFSRAFRRWKGQAPADWPNGSTA